MSFVVQKRSYTEKMHSLFHYSLIKMVVLHQMERKGIPWDVFIANEIFTSPQPHHQSSLPSSSHPPPSTPPYPPTDHASSSTQAASPQENPLPHLLPMHQNRKEVAVSKTVTMMVNMKMSQA